MKKILLILLSCVFLQFGCSKDAVDYAESKRITYQFSPGGNDSQFSLYSNKEGKYISGEVSTLYSYQDDVRPGDKITLTLSTTEEIRGVFQIRVSMDGDMIFSSNKIENTFPKSIVITESLDKSYFKK